jgi:hypothetical protein
MKKHKSNNKQGSKKRFEEDDKDCKKKKGRKQRNEEEENLGRKEIRRKYFDESSEESEVDHYKPKDKKFWKRSTQDSDDDDDDDDETDCQEEKSVVENENVMEDIKMALIKAAKKVPARKVKCKKGKAKQGKKQNRNDQDSKIFWKDLEFSQQPKDAEQSRYNVDDKKYLGFGQNRFPFFPKNFGRKKSYTPYNQKPFYQYNFNNFDADQNNDRAESRPNFPLRKNLFKGHTFLNERGNQFGEKRFNGDNFGGKQFLKQRFNGDQLGENQFGEERRFGDSGRNQKNFNIHINRYSNMNDNDNYDGDYKFAKHPQNGYNKNLRHQITVGIQRPAKFDAVPFENGAAAFEFFQQFFGRFQKSAKNYEDYSDEQKYNPGNYGNQNNGRPQTYFNGGENRKTFDEVVGFGNNFDRSDEPKNNYQQNWNGAGFGDYFDRSDELTNNYQQKWNEAGFGNYYNRPAEPKYEASQTSDGYGNVIHKPDQPKNNHQLFGLGYLEAQKPFPNNEEKQNPGHVGLNGNKEGYKNQYGNDPPKKFGSWNEESDDDHLMPYKSDLDQEDETDDDADNGENDNTNDQTDDQPNQHKDSSNQDEENNNEFGHHEDFSNQADNIHHLLNGQGEEKKAHQNNNGFGHHEDFSNQADNINHLLNGPKQAEPEKEIYPKFSLYHA